MAWFVGALALVAAAHGYQVAHEDVTAGGYVCGGSQNARVYYPQGARNVTSISFAHGFTAANSSAYDGYASMLEAVAAAGYVVIVPESSAIRTVGECPDQWKDQAHSLGWLKTSKFADMIDFSKKTGILGHSMGGGSTYHCAGQASAVIGQNIGAAVALQPQISGPRVVPFMNITNSLIPIFFGTGSADWVASPLSVKLAYYDTENVSKVFSELQGGTHFEPCNNNSNRHTEYAIGMYDCHLLGHISQCDKVYGSGSGSLCSGKVEMTACEHAVPNASDACDVCNTGICAPCKACMKSETGTCASCWSDCLADGKHACQKCWSSSSRKSMIV